MRKHHAPQLVDGERAAPRGRCRSARAAPPASASRPPACSGRQRRASRARRGRSRPSTSTRVADGPFDRVAAAIDLRRHALDLDACRRIVRLRKGHSVNRFSSGSDVNEADVQLQRSSGILLHPTSLPSGRLDADAYSFVDWLAAAGQSWWQMLPLGPPDEHGSPYRARSAFAGSAQLLAEPKAPVSERRGRGIGGAAVLLGRRLGALRGHAVRSPTRCGSSASGSALRAYARERGVRLIGDVPIYVADVRRRRRDVAGALRARRGGRRAAGCVERERTAVGEPALRLACASRDRAIAGGASASGARSSSSTSRASTTSAASSRTGPCRRGTRRRSAAAGCAGPGASCSTPWGSAICRSSQRTSASSRRRCTACATSSGFPAWPC